MVVPSWQGGDDRGLADGAEMLAALVPPACARVSALVPEIDSGDTSAVRHRTAVLAVWENQRRLLAAHQPARLLTLGGDCAVELAGIAHLAARHGPRLFVVWLDAHADLNSPGSSPSGAAHGMPLRLLLDPTIDELGDWHCLRPDQVLLAGTRDVDPPEEEFCRHHRLRLLDVHALLDDPSALRDALPDQAAVYLHLDLDVVDPAALPAVAVPVPDGLSPTALTAALATIHRGADVVGIGITEYVPGVGHDETVVARILAALGLDRSAPALLSDGT